MMWFGDTGQILAAADIKVNWGYELPTPSERWIQDGTHKSWYRIELTDADVTSAGLFNVVKLAAGYGSSRDNTICINRWQFNSYPSIGLDTESDMGSKCIALEESEGVVLSGTTSLTRIVAEGYRDPEWIYHDPADLGLTSITFGVISTTADWQGDDFLNRRKITVKKEVVHGNPVNIPVKVDFDSSDEALIFALANYKTGAMVQVFTPDDVEVPCEAGVRYDSKTGKLTSRLFFLAPSLSSTADSDFYFYYGSKSTVPATFRDADTWPKYDGVWHDNCEIVGAFASARGF